MNGQLIDFGSDVGNDYAFCRLVGLFRIVFNKLNM